MAVAKYDREGRPSPYGVRWTVDGKRRFKFFPTAAARNEFFREMVRKEKEGGRSILELTAAEAAVMRRCLELLGSPEAVLEACKEAEERGSLVTVEPGKAVSEYLAEKMALGRDENYQRAVRVVLWRAVEALPGRFADWSRDRAQDWLTELAGTFSATTVTNHAKVCGAFARWCVRRQYLREDVFAAVATPDVMRPEPGFLSVRDMRKLLEVAQERFPETVAYFAMGAFAGLRSSACARLDLSAIDFGQRGISIRADQAKNKRRVYIDGHPDALWVWLEWARKHAPEGFGLTKRRWDFLRGEVAEAAGVSMPHNALRHSFCTYHVALHGDAGKTATLLTHRGNVSILYEHYRGNATREQAREWFGLEPTH
jgi:integrase